MLKQKAMSTAPSRAETSRKRVVNLIIFGMVGNVIMAAILTVFFSRTIANRLASLCQDTRSLVKEPIAAIDNRGDEISELGHTLKEVTAALADARHKERALTNNAADVICSIDENCRFVKTNTCRNENLGLSTKSN